MPPEVEAVPVVAITSLARSAVNFHLILAPIDTLTILDIDFVQVLVLLYVVGMQIADTVLILIIQGPHLEVVILAMGGIVVDFEILHPPMLEEEVVADHLAEVLMGLDLVQGLLEGRA